MKKVLNRKAYDTATAKKLAVASNNDASRWSETLYRTAKGKYFVARESASMVCWAKSCGQDSWSAGSGVRVLTEDDAREWVEIWASAEYEEIFGEPAPA